VNFTKGTLKKAMYSDGHECAFLENENILYGTHDLGWAQFLLDSHDYVVG